MFKREDVNREFYSPSDSHNDNLIIFYTYKALSSNNNDKTNIPMSPQNITPQITSHWPSNQLDIWTCFAIDTAVNYLKSHANRRFITSAKVTNKKSYEKEVARIIIIDSALHTLHYLHSGRRVKPRPLTLTRLVPHPCQNRQDNLFVFLVGFLSLIMCPERMRSKVKLWNKKGRDLVINNH